MKFQLPFGSHRKVNIDQSDEVTMTHQSFQNECDINQIIARYEKTGLLTHVRQAEPQYGDFIDACDFQLGLHLIQEARDSFMTLPSSLRKRFGNDPQVFLEFVQDPTNREEMIQLGMIIPSPDESGFVQPASGSVGVT